jgi:hypothetical protein
VQILSTSALTRPPSDPGPQDPGERARYAELDDQVARCRDAAIPARRRPAGESAGECAAGPSVEEKGGRGASPVMAGLCGQVRTRLHARRKAFRDSHAHTVTQAGGRAGGRAGGQACIQARACACTHTHTLSRDLSTHGPGPEGL